MDIGTLTGSIELDDEMSGVLIKVNVLLNEFGKTAQQQAQKTDTLQTSMSSLGKTMSVGLTAPILAAGTAVVAAGLQIEGAMNTIARRSGETGAALDALKHDFEVVFSQVPNSAAEVATAITDVHSRLGLTGEELQQVTKRFIDFANVNQVEVAGATRTVSTLIKALELDTADASSIMDKLTYASQQSGLSVTRLGEGVIAGGIAFKEMGFGLDESIALFAQFEKVGANVTDVTSSLHRTLGRLAKEGITDTKAAFAQLLDDIKTAPTFMDGARLAIEAFGAKAGPKLVEEIRGGTYEIGGMVEALQKLTGHTDKTAAASESVTEKLGILRNQVTLALAPLGVELLGAFQKMIPAMTDAAKVLSTMVDWFVELPEPVQATALVLTGLVAASGPVMLGLGSLLKSVNLVKGALSSTAVEATAAGGAFKASGLLVGGFTTALAGIVVPLALERVTELVKQIYGYMKDQEAWKLGALQESATHMRMLEEASRVAGRDVTSVAEGLKILRERALEMQQSAGVFGPMRVEAGQFKTNLDDVKVSMDGARVVIERTGTEVAKAAGHVDLMAQRVQNLMSNAIEPLTVAQQAYITKLDEAGVGVEKISAAIGASEESVRSFLALHEDVVKLMAEENKAFGQIDVSKLTQAFAHLNDMNDSIAAQARQLSNIEAEWRMYQDAGMLAAEKANAMWDSVKEHSNASLQATADKAKETYEYVAAHAEQFAPAVIEKFRLIAEEAARAASGIQGDLSNAFIIVGATAEASAQRAVMSWSQAMDLVRQGMGTLSGTVQSGPLTPASKTAVQHAYDSGNYYGPVVNGSQLNPRGTGPDFAALGYRARGGPVSAGDPYVVGERGPEVFVPNVSGAVVPNGVGGSVVVNMNGLLLTTDPGAKAALREAVQDAVMAGMRQSTKFGSA